MQKFKFTLIELLVVIAIVSILATLISPLVSRSRESARRFACQANMRNIGISMKAYALDNSGALPPSVANRGGGSNRNYNLLDNHPALGQITNFVTNTGLPTSKVNPQAMHFSYVALHNVGILTNPTVYKCPSRSAHNVSDDIYNVNIAQGAGTNNYGNDQRNTELSYPYFVNRDGSDDRAGTTAIERLTLQESNYGGETNITRDRVINHGGYDYGNVLYGDGHAEAKEIIGGDIATGGSPERASSNSWLTYHNNTTQPSRVQYNPPIGEAFEGDTNGLRTMGSILWFDNPSATGHIDNAANTNGNPP